MPRRTVSSKTREFYLGPRQRCFEPLVGYDGTIRVTAAVWYGTCTLINGEISEIDPRDAKRWQIGMDLDPGTGADLSPTETYRSIRISTVGPSLWS